MAFSYARAFLPLNISAISSVECIGNTQFIHMEETGITQRTIGIFTVNTISELSQVIKPIMYNHIFLAKQTTYNK